MISINEALNSIKLYSNYCNTQTQPINKALGYILAEDINAPINLPPFAQSAMDGYAIKLNIDVNNLKFIVINEVKAGDAIDSLNLSSGEAVRIFTGAVVPTNADAVIMQEKVEVDEDSILLMDVVKPQSNIRPIGEQIRKDEVALLKGTLLNPAGIGFLTSLGITEVAVYSKPSISVIVTGNELVQPGKPLANGQIYESNSYTLVAALNQTGFEVNTILKVTDTYQDTFDVIEESLNLSDIVIVTGGISVGDYDFVGKVLPDLGVEQIYYKINQKPGKPMYFGKKGDKLVFSLPGNPAAALSCFYMYVLPALKNRSGQNNFELETISLPIVSDYNKKGARAHLLKAKITDNRVEPLEGQSSAMLHTFALANALIYIPDNINEVKKGDTVKVFKLPN